MGLEVWFEAQMGFGPTKEAERDVGVGLCSAKDAEEQRRSEFV